MGEGMQKKRNFFGCNFSLRKNRRGLSAIVTTLLIILLSIVAIGAVWVVISNVIDEGSEDINLARFTLDIAIKSAYVDTADSNKIKVSVRRSVGKGDVKGVNFVFSDGSNSVVVREDVVLNELEERTFTFFPDDVPGIGSGDTVSVAPIFDSSGSEKTGEITDTEKISSTVSSGGGPSGGGPSGTCPDGNIQNPNNDIPPINEQCDGTNLGGNGCTDIQDFTGGDLDCTPGCQWDTSSCTGGTPVTCGNGGLDAGEECDGTPTPNGCAAATCTCEPGFNGDGSGGCSLNPAINSGIIQDVFTSTEPFQFFSSDLPYWAEQSLQNSYVSFTGGVCKRIDFHNRVGLIDYVRLESAAPGLTAGNSYDVWEAENCGYP